MTYLNKRGWKFSRFLDSIISLCLSDNGEASSKFGIFYVCAQREEKCLPRTLAVRDTLFAITSVLFRHHRSEEQKKTTMMMAVSLNEFFPFFFHHPLRAWERLLFAFMSSPHFDMSQNMYELKASNEQQLIISFILRHCSLIQRKAKLYMLLFSTVVAW